MGDVSPFELPPEQTGEAAWYGPQMSQRTDWLMALDPTEIADESDAGAVIPKPSEVPPLPDELTKVTPSCRREVSSSPSV